MLDNNDILAIEGAISRVIDPKFDRVYEHMSKSVSDCSERHDKTINGQEERLKSVEACVNKAKGMGMLGKTILAILSAIGIGNLVIWAKILLAKQP